MSLRLIKEIHEHLRQGVIGVHATPEDFRVSQNWIGYPGCTLNTAKFVPPPPENLMDSLGAFEKILNDLHDRSLPPLIHIALCQYNLKTFILF